MQLSVVIPAFDEAQSLPSLLERLVVQLEELGAEPLGEATMYAVAQTQRHPVQARPYPRISPGATEVIVVDDGSRDGTAGVVEALALPGVRVERLRVNRGKSAALRTGLAVAKGEVIALMDADGQDDPAELPRLLAALDGEGLDLVTGRRAQRNDRAAKRLPSRLYNWTTARVTGVPGRDFNSGFKVMRRDVARDLDLYGELHRYIPVLAVWAGYRIGEVDVTHHPRAEGQSKFGRERFWRGLLDLVTVKFLTTYTVRPFHLFGGLGALFGAVGAALLTWMLVLRIGGEQIGDRPALLAGILFVVVAVQLVSLGLLAELLVHLRRTGPADDRDR